MNNYTEEEMGSFVVIAVPTVFAERRAALLARNAKAALKAAGHRFGSVARDGPLVVVEGAEDPVLASASVRMLSGVRRVGIAFRSAGAPLADAAGFIAQASERMLLENEWYLVRVEGRPRGYVPGDLEMAATSAIIERRSTPGARPGTPARHDRELYSYVTGRHLYACLFADGGMGGVPAGTHPEPVACCMFDGLSAAACFEAIRQGYDVRMSVAYSAEAELRRLARAAGRLVPRTAESLLGGGPVGIEFARIKKAAGGRAGRLLASCLLAAEAAERDGIKRAVLPVSPVVDSQAVIDAAAAELARRGVAAYAPLGALEDEVFAHAAAAGFEEFAREAARLAAASAAGGGGASAAAGALARARKMAAGASRRRVSVRAGPNTVHEMLDAVIGGGNRGNKGRRRGAPT